MSNKFFDLLIMLFFVCGFSFAQQADSLNLIYAEGKIINAATREPVTAHITYQSLPYGSRMGTLHNSVYSFPMFDNEKYTIIVEANGFVPAKYLIDPMEANGQNKVVKDIELSVGVAKSHAIGQVMRLDNLIFQLGRSKISPESYNELEVVVNMMKENEKMVIQLEGHTDYQGSPKENMKLSKDRVNAVKNHLVSRGVPKNRIKTKAFGGTVPLSRENTPEAHRMNRRVELRILEN